MTIPVIGLLIALAEDWKNADLEAKNKSQDLHQMSNELLATAIETIRSNPVPSGIHQIFNGPVVNAAGVNNGELRMVQETRTFRSNKSIELITALREQSQMLRGSCKEDFP